MKKNMAPRTTNVCPTAIPQRTIDKAVKHLL